MFWHNNRKFQTCTYPKFYFWFGYKKQKKIKKIHSRGHMNYISVSKTVSSLNILLNQGHM